MYFVLSELWKVIMVDKSGWNCSVVIAKPSFLDSCLDKSPELPLKNQNLRNIIRFTIAGKLPADIVCCVFVQHCIGNKGLFCLSTLGLF